MVAGIKGYNGEVKQPDLRCNICIYKCGKKLILKIILFSHPPQT
jgi:hypothetical protein